MKYKINGYSVSRMARDYEKAPGQNNRLEFNCPIQRPEGQWSNLAQSLLIHSILQEYIIPNVCIVQNGADDFEPMTVLDGKQRMTIVYNFLTGGFQLNKNTPSVEVVVPDVDEDGNLIKDENGKTITHIEYVEIRNKRFNKLPKDFQDKIKAFEFTAIMITEATKTELEEQMFRLNNGKTPSATLKAFMKGGIDVANAIRDKVICNNFFENRFILTPTQKKNAEDMRCAFHILTILSGADYNKLTSGDLTKVAQNMKEEWANGNFSEIDIDYCNDLLEALNQWLPNDDSGIDMSKILTTIHTPILVMNVEKAKQLIEDELLTVEDYKRFLMHWVTTGFYCDEYQKYSEKTPSDRVNIEGRINVMETKLNDFINK